MKFFKWLLLVLICCKGFAQSPPVEPKFMEGGIKRFYQYITDEIDFSKVADEKTMRVTFYLDPLGVMSDITTTEFKNQAAAAEVIRVLKKAPKWDVSNQDKRNPFIKYKIKLIFSNNKVLGETQVGWFSVNPTAIVDKSEEKKSSLTDAPLVVEVAETKAYNANEEDNNIYNTAGIEVKPEFPGGLQEFYKFIGSNFKVPNVKGLTGKIFVTFVIEKDGSVRDVKVIRDIGYGTAEEAIRVLTLCPKWIPGEQAGRKVRVLFALPITIQPK